MARSAKPKPNTRRRARRNHRPPKLHDSVDIWWYVDKTFYRGRLIRQYDNKPTSFRVRYDDGELEDIDLANEYWKFADDHETPPPPSSFDQHITHHPDDVILDGSDIPPTADTTPSPVAPGPSASAPPADTSPADTSPADTSPADTSPADTPASTTTRKRKHKTTRAVATARARKGSDDEHDEDYVVEVEPTANAPDNPTANASAKPKRGRPKKIRKTRNTPASHTHRPSSSTPSPAARPPQKQPADSSMRRLRSHTDESSVTPAAHPVSRATQTDAPTADVYANARAHVEDVLAMDVAPPSTQPANAVSNAAAGPSATRETRPTREAATRQKANAATVTHKDGNRVKQSSETVSVSRHIKNVKNVPNGNQPEGRSTKPSPLVNDPAAKNRSKNPPDAKSSIEVSEHKSLPSTSEASATPTPVLKPSPHAPVTTPSPALSDSSTANQPDAVENLDLVLQRDLATTQSTPSFMPAGSRKSSGAAGGIKKTNRPTRKGSGSAVTRRASRERSTKSMPSQKTTSNGNPPMESVPVKVPLRPRSDDETVRASVASSGEEVPKQSDKRITTPQGVKGSSSRPASGQGKTSALRSRPSPHAAPPSAGAETTRSAGAKSTRKGPGKMPTPRERQGLRNRPRSEDGTPLQKLASVSLYGENETKKMKSNENMVPDSVAGLEHDLDDLTHIPERDATLSTLINRRLNPMEKNLRTLAEDVNVLATQNQTMTMTMTTDALAKTVERLEKETRIELGIIREMLRQSVLRSQEDRNETMRLLRELKRGDGSKQGDGSGARARSNAPQRRNGRSAQPQPQAVPPPAEDLASPAPDAPRRGSARISRPNRLEPGFENDAPGFENDAPGFENDAPGFENDAPGFENDAPGFENDVPGFENDVPGFENDVPGFENDAPGFENDAPGHKTVAVRRENTPPALSAEQAARGASEHGADASPTRVAGDIPPDDDSEQDPSEGKQIAPEFVNRVVHVMARQMTVWLLETPHEYDPKRMKCSCDEWARLTTVTAFQRLSARMLSFESYSQAHQTLSTSLGNDSVELSWFTTPDKPELVKKARRNYAAWDPPPTNCEWESEILLLTEISSAFHRALLAYKWKKEDELTAAITIARESSVLYELMVQRDTRLVMNGNLLLTPHGQDALGQDALGQDALGQDALRQDAPGQGAPGQGAPGQTKPNGPPHDRTAP